MEDLDRLRALFDRHLVGKGHAVTRSASTQSLQPFKKKMRAKGWCKFQVHASAG